jgi:hypothetical protein
MPIFLDHLNYTPARELYAFKIIMDFCHNINEKLHTHHSKLIVLLFTFTETCIILKGQTCN